MDPQGGATAQQTLQNQQAIQNMKQGQPGQGQRQGRPAGRLAAEPALRAGPEGAAAGAPAEGWEAAAEREKSNNPATKDQREYDERAWHGSGQPAGS